MLDVISSYSSPRRNDADGARFTTTTIGVDGASARASTVHASRRAMPTGLASHTATSTSASTASARAVAKRPRGGPPRSCSDPTPSATTIVGLGRRADRRRGSPRPGRTCAQLVEFGMPPRTASSARVSPLDARDAGRRGRARRRRSRCARLGSSGRCKTLRDRGRDVVAVGQHDASSRAPRRPRARSRPRCGRRRADRRRRRADPDTLGEATRQRRFAAALRSEQSATSARTNASGPASFSIDRVDLDRGEMRPARRLGRGRARRAPRARACTSATNARVSAGQR